MDETLLLERLEPARVNRVREVRRRAGGKGVNVAGMLGEFGQPCAAAGFLGAANAALFEEFLRRAGVEDLFLRVGGETRRGIKVVEECPADAVSGHRRTTRTTDLNLPGIRIEPPDAGRILGQMRGLAAAGRSFAVCGSLPPGFGIAQFSGLLQILKAAGAWVAVDTSGPALRAALECRVDLLKPNLHEIEELCGRSLPDTESRRAALAELHAAGAGTVILSLGAEGALFSTGDCLLRVGAPPAPVVSTVGAGDALLAGYLAGVLGGRPPEECARLGAVFAWSALEDAGRKLAPREVVAERLRQIQVAAL